MMGEITLDKFLSFWIVLYSFGYVLKIFPYKLNFNNNWNI